MFYKEKYERERLKKVQVERNDENGDEEQEAPTASGSWKGEDTIESEKSKKEKTRMEREEMRKEREKMRKDIEKSQIAKETRYGISFTGS